MTLRNIIKAILAGEALTMKSVARQVSQKLGKEFSLQNFSSKLKSETLNYKELKTIADIAGYELKFIKKQ